MIENIGKKPGNVSSSLNKGKKKHTEVTVTFYTK